jgi:hypothetical protein
MIICSAYGTWKTREASSAGYHKELCASRGVEQQALAAITHEVAECISEFNAQIYFPHAVPSLEERLDDSPLRFLLDAESTEVFGGVLVYFDAKRLASSEWSAASK